jgi:hypothetical protein
MNLNENVERSKRISIACDAALEILAFVFSDDMAVPLDPIIESHQ